MDASKVLIILEGLAPSTEPQPARGHTPVAQNHAMLQDVEDMVDETGIPRIVGLVQFVVHFPSQHHLLEEVPSLLGIYDRFHRLQLCIYIAIHSAWPV